MLFTLGIYLLVKLRQKNELLLLCSYFLLDEATLNENESITTLYRAKRGSYGNIRQNYGYWVRQCSILDVLSNNIVIL